ncbi:MULTISPECIES: diacylglycerol kinase family protein [Jeotgalicoccus]|uniref:Diacylglycerol kinase family protein n=1 Tax=Jeotgalicoccus nanhaiensis TaxID=568603 RepID=A0ABR9XX10_9STAP|nr:diacylglycerol kinase family protein [Jeotgalicoccus nanhaiensis]MBF0753270.1 diacylglycerol kinase family protein [Jeotgalicoccus nanhaiensis]TFU62440.1 diacylglycerol kinase family protein [Jeotgalicoccus nanhaiensis]
MNPDRFKHPLQGLFQLFKKDRKFLLHLIFAAAAICICAAVNITAVEWLFIITAVFLVLITETINSAIEYTVDLVTGDYHILARYAKDIAAAAVLLASVYAVIVGMVILIPYFY